MTTAPARISVSHGGHEQVLPQAADAARQVTSLLQAHVDASDVTISIRPSDHHGLILVALESGRAFVGLETAGGVYQYIADAAAEGTRQFLIGGQSTAIDARYVLSIPQAIELLKACMTKPDPFAATAWERQ